MSLSTRIDANPEAPVGLFARDTSLIVCRAAPASNNSVLGRLAKSAIVWVLCFECVLLVGFGFIGYSNPGNLSTPMALVVHYPFFLLLGLALAGR